MKERRSVRDQTPNRSPPGGSRAGSSLSLDASVVDDDVRGRVIRLSEDIYRINKRVRVRKFGRKYRNDTYMRKDRNYVLRLSDVRKSSSLVRPRSNKKSVLQATQIIGCDMNPRDAMTPFLGTRIFWSRLAITEKGGGQTGNGFVLLETRSHAPQTSTIYN